MRKKCLDSLLWVIVSKVAHSENGYSEILRHESSRWMTQQAPVAGSHANVAGGSGVRRQGEGGKTLEILLSFLLSSQVALGKGMPTFSCKSSPKGEWSKRAFFY